MNRLATVLLALTIIFSSFLHAGEDAAATARKKLLQERLMDHFAFGVDAPLEWLNETRDKNGAKWDARVAYISGGAAKEQSWDTVFLNPWNKWVNPDKRRGVFAENFIKDSVNNGYIAWITFYNLAQSNPADYKPGPAQATPTNAKVKETMKAYFEQVKLIMQLADKYKPHLVVVQFEPDEWGHLLLGGGKGGKLDPETVDIKVGSSGMEDVKDLPDNLIGYAQGIKRLRDKYAPTNVLIGCNPSGWDWRGSMTGKKFGEYLNKCGCNEWDLAVFETGDRDKGMHGKPPPYNDESGICEKFDNHLNWIKEFHETTKLPLVVWQVAMGNTYFSTCNNTPGHYCDNLAQTVFEDYPKNPMISRYVAAGCVGWMFNAGQGDSTHCWDERKDGITNPVAIGGNAGNKSEYPDDDGGYMRLRAAAYYKNPFPIMGKAAKTASASTEKKDDAGSSSAAAATTAPKPPPPPTVDAKVLESFEARLKARIAAACKAGSMSAYLRPMGPKSPEDKCAVNAIEGDNLTITLQGNKLPLAWKQLSLRDKVNLAKGALSKTDAESLVIAAVFLMADGRSEEAESCFSEAAALNPSLEKETRAALGMK